MGRGLGARGWETWVGAIYVDVLEKKLVEVVPKGAFGPLFGATNVKAANRENAIGRDRALLRTSRRELVERREVHAIDAVGLLC